MYSTRRHVSSRTSRKGRTPTTSRRSPRSIPKIFGIALVTADGKVYTAGDIKSEVSIQSISKVFTLAKVIEEQGPEAIEKTIGVDATGMRFNSIVSVEFSQKALGGPGDELAGQPGRDRHHVAWSRAARRAEVWKSILAFHSDFAGRPLTVNSGGLQVRSRDQSAQPGHRRPDVRLRLHQGQPGAGHRHLHRAVLDQRQRQGSRHHGGHARQRRQEPGDEKQVMSAKNVPYVLAVMATAGLYDDSGKWLYHTGLPAKSGVGGGIIAVAPGKFGIAVISPPLDDAGNSVRAQKAIAEIVARLERQPLRGRSPVVDALTVRTPCGRWHGVTCSTT